MNESTYFVDGWMDGLDGWMDDPRRGYDGECGVKNGEEGGDEIEGREGDGGCGWMWVVGGCRQVVMTECNM